MKMYKELTLSESVSEIRKTEFYKQHIGKLYVCDEDPYRIVFEAGPNSTYEEEISFVNDMESIMPYSLFNIDYMEYLENGEPSLTLKEVQ